MRVIQMLSTMAYGDAIGNDTIALKKVIEDLGYETAIYAESIVPPINNSIALPVSKIKECKEDIIIYHLSTGSELNYKLAEYSARKIVIYHNVTPPHFFLGNNELFYHVTKQALEGVQYLSDKVDYCLSDSDFNKQELLDIGYRCPIDILPILVPFEDYKKQPNRKIINSYQDGKTNIIFTGRIAPNKCQEDVIRAFYCYKKYFDSSARLFLVGSFKQEDIYYQRLVNYVEKLELEDVYFTGHIKFDEVLAYYKIADVFLCMSEHEGFCVPLLEAMFFDIPIIAYNCTAIPFTLSGSGIMLNEKEPIVAAKMIHLLLNDMPLREKVLHNQRIRLKDFAYDKIREQFEKYLASFIGGNV